MKIINALLAKLPKIDEKNRNWFLGVLMLAIFLLDYFFIMGPFQLRPLTKLSPKIRKADDNLKMAKKDIKSVEDYKRQLALVKDEMDVVGMRILSKEEIPKILDNISRLAIDLDVRINQIMPLIDSQTVVLENDEGKYYALSILITARGAYHEIGRFFNKIEKDEVFLTITDFDIAANNEDPMRHTVKLTIKTFIVEKGNGKENL